MEYLTLLYCRILPPPANISAVRAQLIFMAGRSHSSHDFDLSSAIILDSGCSQHTFATKEYFTDFKPFKRYEKGTTISGIGDTVLRAIGTGTVVVRCHVLGSLLELTLTNVLYCPDLKANLISCSQLVEKVSNVHIIIKKKQCEIFKDDLITFTAHQKYGLYIVNTWSDRQEALRAFGLGAYGATNDAVTQLWHRRLGHLGIENLKILQGMATGLDLKHLKSMECACEACLKSRKTDIAHRNSLAVDAQPYEVIYSDVEGPLTTGFDQSLYFVTFTDACTKESEVYFIKYKEEVPAMFRLYKALKENQNPDRRIKRLHSDGGGEYTGHNFQFSLAEEGIIFSYSTPESQQQNGVAERMNRTLKESAFAMLQDSELKRSYWPLAVRHANYLRNRSPVKGLTTTPFEAVTGKPPDLSFLKPFGCLVWYRAGSQKKFRSFIDDRAQPGSFVGFDSPHGTVVKILPKSGLHVIRAASVHFQEYRTIQDVGKINRPIVPSIEDTDPPFWEETSDPALQSSKEATPLIEKSAPLKRGRPKKVQFAEQPSTVASTTADSQSDSSSSSEKEAEPLRRSTRKRKKSRKAFKLCYRDPQRETARHTFKANETIDLRCQNANLSQHEYSLLAANHTFNYLTLLANALPDEPYEPQSWSSAITSSERDKWIIAATDEIASLEANKTWTLDEAPIKQRVLAGKWVFKFKRGANGEILRYKARWVAKGYEQQYGVDYDQTFASVVKPMSYKSLFAVAAALDLEIEQMDVKTAFLYGAVEENIYIQQPEGFDDNSGRVCKLNKSLYGLKQSPRVWYKLLSSFLASQGFQALDADLSVFYKDSTFIAAYVDDLLIIGPDKLAIQDIKKALSSKFSMVDLGPIAFYLGMAIKRDRPNRILRIGQRAYLHEAIRACGLENDPSPFTPMLTTRLEPAPESYTAPPDFKARYQSYVGTLMYAMLGSRPDIAFAVSSVSRYASNPTEEHMQAVHRILKYLNGTINYQLTYRGTLAPLIGYSDADWGGDLATYRSTSGFVFNIGSGAISWSAKRQPTVALSSCQAEHAGQTQAAKEAIWLRQLLAQLIPTDDKPYATIIYCDNQGAIALAKDPRFHSRTKHIAIQHHWIREHIANGAIDLQYISTNRQMADGLTKALPRAPFESFRDALGLEHN